MAKKAVETVKVKAEVAKHGIPDKKRGTWSWHEVDKGKRWTSALIPDGDWCGARVERSFSKAIDGTFDYYAYRNGKILGKRKAHEEAQGMCERGEADVRRGQLDYYLNDHPGDMPAFLKLTEEERACIRKHYTYAVPKEDRTVAARRKLNDAGDDSDRTKQLRVQLAGSKGQVVAKAPRTRELAETPQGKLKRAREGNPKKAGTAAFGRWDLLLKHCDKGSTVAVFLKDGGNAETLRNAILKGFAIVEEK